MICEAKSFEFQDVLLLIGFTRRTGELELESGNNFGNIFFRNGVILHALSPYSRAIGDLLVEDGIITEAELLEMLRLQKKNPDIPIGAMFIRAGKVKLDVIEMMVHEQIRAAIKEFAGWPNLQATFIQKEFTPFDEIHMPVQEFIMPDALRTAMDFMSGIQSQIPKSSLTPAASASA